MRLIKYLKKYWLYAILSALCMVGEVVCDLFLPLRMAEIINVGIKQSQMSVIYEQGIYMIILTILGGIGGYLSAVFSSIASRKFANDLRKDVFKQTINFSWSQTDKFTAGSLVTRVTSDITQIQMLVSMSVRMFVRTFSLFFGGIGFMVGINPEFGIILLCVLPLQILVLIFFLKRVNPKFGEVQNALDDVNSCTKENVNGSRVVKAFGNEEYEATKFNNVSTILANKNLSVQKLLSFMSPFLTFLLDVTIILIIYVGGQKVFSDPNFKVGDVSAALTYIMQILMAVMNMGMLFQHVARASASAKRILEVLDTKPEIVSGCIENDIEGSIEFSNVEFQYLKNTEPVLEKISFKLDKGETLAILGATGSGKSTIVNLIPRFYDVTGGDILIDGINIKDYDIKYLRENIAVVLQKAEMFSGTIKENIAWGKKDATDEEIIEAARIAQADSFITKFSDGYDTVIGEKGSTLSGGQKQRISIARAILKKPKVLIFDDATSAIDLKTEANLYKALRETLKDTTFILVAQRVASAKSAGKILVLEDGKVSGIGTSDELLKSNEVYQDIYYSQLKKEENEDE